MGKFLKIPELRWISAAEGWELTTPLIFLSDHFDPITVPVGFRTNLASVPRLPLVHLWTGGRANMPAVLHDYLYGCCQTEMTRKQADQIFLEAMKDINDPGNAFTRRAMYMGVRLGGGKHWRQVPCNKCPAAGQNGIFRA